MALTNLMRLSSQERRIRSRVRRSMAGNPGRDDKKERVVVRRGRLLKDGAVIGAAHQLATAPSLAKLSPLANALSSQPTSPLSSNQLYFKPPNKAVILSEALHISIANRGLYGAESKDPGDACWQMLLGAFRPQTTTEDKKVTNSRA
jgi:hypothetical protein